MSITKDFDAAIAAAEEMAKGFVTEKRVYSSYMSNAAWDEYLANMSVEHRSQFDDGSGGELQEKNGRPPKMASFASSSRMTYQLSKEIPGFVFEKQLATVIGGVANLDGYCEEKGRFVFVEAKCREPYSHKSPQIIKRNYKPLYTYLQNELPELFSCRMEDIPETRDMSTTFFCRGKKVVYFDMKQMLCHLLGVANKMLQNCICEAPIQFLYLLYNPTDLVLPDESKREILYIYQETCEAALNYDFQRIFGCVVDFLLDRKEYTTTETDAEKIKENFMFALCDQHNYGKYFS